VLNVKKYNYIKKNNSIINISLKNLILKSTFLSVIQSSMFSIKNNPKTGINQYHLNFLIIIFILLFQIISKLFFIYLLIN
jgi:hypothetical protein